MIMPAAFVSSASGNVLDSSRLAVPSVTMIRILGTPGRAPVDSLNIFRRTVRSAAAMFVSPRFMSTPSIALTSDSLSPYVLRWKTISTSVLNFNKPTCVKVCEMGNAPAILLAKPSTCTYQLS